MWKLPSNNFPLMEIALKCYFSLLRSLLFLKNFLHLFINAIKIPFDVASIHTVQCTGIPVLSNTTIPVVDCVQTIQIVEHRDCIEIACIIIKWRISNVFVSINAKYIIIYLSMNSCNQKKVKKKKENYRIVTCGYDDRKIDKDIMRIELISIHVIIKLCR